MVSLREHFVPNPVSPFFGSFQVRASRSASLFIHTRYDVLGNRISKEFTSDATKNEYYVAERGQEVLIFDNLKRLSERGLYNPTAVDQLMATDKLKYDGTSASVDMLAWALLDQQNTVRDLLYKQGSGVYALQNYRYDTFGTLTNTPTLKTRFAYAGRDLDPETGEYFSRARTYDSRSGRFLQPDPIPTPGGSLYAYCGNSPMDRTDPSGCIWGLGAAASGAVIGGLVGGFTEVGMSLILRGELPTAGQFFGAMTSGAITGAIVGAAATGDLFTATVIGVGAGMLGGGVGALVQQTTDTIITGESQFSSRGITGAMLFGGIGGAAGGAAGYMLAGIAGGAGGGGGGLLLAGVEGGTYAAGSA